MKNIIAIVSLLVLGVALAIAVPVDDSVPEINQPLVDPTPPSRPVPEGYQVCTVYGSSVFKYMAEDLDHTKARERCVADGGDLVVVDTESKLECAVNVHDKSQLMGGIAVGIYRKANTTDWLSVRDDTPVTTVPWGPDEPDSDPEHNCACLWKFGAGVKLFNFDCEVERPFICEIVL